MNKGPAALLSFTLLLLLGTFIQGREARSAGQQPSAAAPGAWEWLDPANDGDTVTLLLMGDTNIQDRKDPGSAYTHVLATLQAADLRFTNLEGPFSGTSKDPSVPDIPHKKGWKHSEPEMVQGLLAAGIDGVGVANNVTYPWQALMRSLEVLNRAGIPYTGGGRNLDEAHKPLILERKGVRFGFQQYAATVFPYNHAAGEDTPGIAAVKVHTYYEPPPDLDKPGQPPIVVTIPDEASLQRMVNDIRDLRQRVDILVVSYHWGVSASTKLIDYQKALAHAAVDAGADIVMGHGPHKYQRVEIHKGKPILYSLSNFVFDWPVMRRFPEGLLARACIKNRKLASVSLVPLWIGEGNNPRLYDPNLGKGRELYEYLLEVTGEDGARLNLEGKEIVIEGIR
jgi:poly-gamma-glutamate synthesis protein (capsule biosynthesis protein)